MKISVIGSGAMGSRLSEVFLESGNHVFVYDVVKEKCLPLVKKGAVAAKDAVEAAKQCEMLVLSIPDYSTTNDLIEEYDLFKILNGKILVQLSSGSPDEARDLQKNAQQKRVHYIDGAIMCTPAEVGSQEAVIFYAGDPGVFNSNINIFKSIAQNAIFVGEDAGLAAALDIALQIGGNAFNWGFLQGAAFCIANNLPVSDYTQYMLASMEVQASITSGFSEKIIAKSYEKTGAALNTWSKAYFRAIEIMKSSRVDTSVPEALYKLQQKAVAAGYGEQDMAALVEIIKVKL